MTYIPTNDEAWSFAVWALQENYLELRAGAKGSGLALTPGECDRLAHNIKWPPNRPPRILDDLHARLLAAAAKRTSTILSPADCELLANNMTIPNRPRGRKPADDMRIALHCLKLKDELGKMEAAVRQTRDDFNVSRITVFKALRKFSPEAVD